MVHHSSATTATTTLLTEDSAPTDTWTHVTWRFDAAEGEQAFFINGVPAGEVFTGTLPYDSATNDLLVGSARGGNFYGGALDELVVYGQAVRCNDQIYDIANPLNVGISDLQIRFRTYEQRDLAPTSGTWYPVTLSSNSSNFVPWTFALPNNFPVGSYKIDLRVTDTVGNGDNSSFIGGAWDGVITLPDLSIGITSDTTLAVLGGDVTHTIFYTNTGSVDATGVQLTNVVPVDSSFNAGLSSAGWNCVPDGATGSTCTYDVGSLAVGQSGSVNFGVTVAGSLSAGSLGIENTAVISSSNDDYDTNDNSATSADA